MITQAEQAMRRWCELEPQLVLAHERLATVLTTHASILERQGDLEAAARCLEQQKTLLGDILSKDPKNNRARLNLVLCQGTIGDLELNREHPEAAVSALREGLDNAEQLIAAEPSNREFQLPRINQLDNLALAYQAGMKVQFDDRLQQFVPEALPPGVFVCGRANGVHDFEARLLDGQGPQDSSAFSARLIRVLGKAVDA